MREDIDPIETQEWLDALDSLVTSSGNKRASQLLMALGEHAVELGIKLPPAITTPYRNTIAPTAEKRIPGDMFMERRIRSLVRWNALAMVMRANVNDEGLGGHLSSFSSSALLYETGFNHFFRGSQGDSLGDLVFFQGHSAPGMYARSFLEGRLDEDQLDNFRREVDGHGLSSYPHPWLMPDYWQFPTVSMGLGPIQAIYQAHFLKYQTKRELVDNSSRKIWCFMGDGESDEPESLGAISLAGREHLDNLIFVVNCNLQRLDGPVRGNGKIVQELEGVFRGAGWNVIKVLWGRHWDPLLEKDTTGLLQRRMNEVCDGELQNFKANGGAYTREHFFGKYPELLELVKDMSDDDIRYLNRGGHDPYKVYAAYYEAVHHKGQPTVILAATVKGYAMGPSAQAQNETHSVKKLDIESLKKFRDRFILPLSDDELANVPYYRPAPDSPEMVYMRQQREQLGGVMPKRQADFEGLEIPSLDVFEPQLKGSGKRSISTTMAFVRMLSTLTKNKAMGHRVVPIIPDEARTFGMEGMFRQLGIYSSVGQRYTPHDSDQIMYYKEDEKGQILEEGITEAGAMSAWIAAATSYSTNHYPMVPFYIFYSMFGFQRIMDLAWAAGDAQARGFLLGATAGRTTLNGEGLQHQDGHSHLMASMIPNCVSYDPAYAYEVAVIIQHGLQQMFHEKRNCFYYVTLLNENYQHQALPIGSVDGIIRGLYRLEEGDVGADLRVQLMGAGSILLEVRAAADILRTTFSVEADVWSMTSVNEVARDAQACERWNALHPEEAPRTCYLQEQLNDENGGPIIASTDYVRAHTNQLSPYMPRRFVALGTDGYGRSDTRDKLRSFFEVDRYFVVVNALKALADEGLVDAALVSKALSDFGIKSNRPDPMVS
jgi:pyruvate dehydrogenase E1 component